MGKYIKLFKDNLERGTYESSADYIEPYVSYVEDDKSVHYNVGYIFCRLYLDDNTVVNIEGEGKLTRDHVAEYVNNIVKVKIGKKCTELQGSEHAETSNIQSTFFGCPALKEVYISTPLETIPAAEFEGCTNLELVSIPHSITLIKKRAFYQCAIKNVVLPKNLIDIEDEAFFNCTRLKTVSGDTHMTSISESAFKGCVSLESINLGDSISSIGQSAFAGCISLRNIDLPNTIINIGTNAFAGSGLVSIKIPDNITIIPLGICNGCPQLENIEFGKNNTTISASAFGACPKLKDIVIPNSITVLNDDCFGNSSCNSIIIPNSVTTIGSNALAFNNIKEMYYDSPVTLSDSFRGSYKGLEKVVVGDTTTIITARAFASTAVKEVTIGKNVTAITSRAFAGCSNIEKLVIPDSVNNLTDGPFNGCTKLKELTLGKGITDMNPVSFAYAPIEKAKYTGTIEEFTSINDYRFWLQEGMPLTVVHCADGDYIIPFSYRLTGDQGKLLLVNYNASELNASDIDRLKGRAVKLETGPVCKRINEKAVYNFTVLREIILDDETSSLAVGALRTNTVRNVRLGNKITTIPENLLRDCMQLETVNIPNSVTSIGGYAFYSTPLLKQIDLPNGIQFIGSNAFNYSGLTEIKLPERLMSIGASAFENQNIIDVTIPKNVTNIGSGAFTAIRNLTIQSESILIFNYVSNSALYIYFGNNIKNVIIDCNPSRIGDYVFYNTKISSITIPNSVKTIGKNAFSGCTDLIDVNLPNALTEIGDNAFNNTSIDKLRLPNTLQHIGNAAFNSSKIKVIDITDNVQDIGANAFYQTYLTNVIIGKRVSFIDANAFVSKSALMKVTAKPITPPRLSTPTFYLDGDAVIYVPKESVDAYKSAWSDYAAYIKPSK